MSVTISRALLAVILERAAAEPDREICGLLLGNGNHITDAIETANLAENCGHRFEVDPTALIAAHRAARAGGPDVIGHYHSHPVGGEEPSLRDAEMAVEEGVLWLICDPMGSHRLWRSRAGGLHDRFEEERLDVEAMPLASPPS